MHSGGGSPQRMTGLSRPSLRQTSPEPQLVALVHGTSHLPLPKFGSEGGNCEMAGVRWHTSPFGQPLESPVLRSKVQAATHTCVCVLQIGVGEWVSQSSSELQAPPPPQWPPLGMQKLPLAGVE